MNQATAASDTRAPRDGLSHVVGSSQPPLSELTIPAWLDATAERYPRAPGLRLSRAGPALDLERAARAGRWLRCRAARRSGFAKGDRVGIWSPNRSEWCLTQFATARIGVVLVNINPPTDWSSSSTRSTRCGCKALITRRALQEQRLPGDAADARARARACAPGRLQAARLPHLRTVIRMGSEPAPGMFNLPVVLRMRPTLPACPRRAASAPAARCFDADQHPVHLRHHRQPEGRDADPSQHRQQRPRSSAQR